MGFCKFFFFFFFFFFFCIFTLDPSVFNFQPVRTTLFKLSMPIICLPDSSPLVTSNGPWFICPMVAHRGFCMGFAWVLHQKPTMGSEWALWAGPSKTQKSPFWAWYLGKNPPPPSGLCDRVGSDNDSITSCGYPCKMVQIDTLAYKGAIITMRGRLFVIIGRHFSLVLPLCQHKILVSPLTH